MKMVKSLLLGSAAGVVAVSGAQAADLPVKAKAVEYVRICPQYGKGFFYLPGSPDVCLSITGFVRFQVNYSDGTAPTGATPSLFTAPQGADVRTGANQALNLRARYMMTFDSRAQTAYGTLRAVATAGFTWEGNPTPATAATYANRGFIQIAGFTMGRAVSFFDFYSAPATSYHATMTGDTGDGGWTVFGYTAQFGGGVSATIAAEDPRRTTLASANASISVGTTTGPGYTNSYVQLRAPDVVANLRWDQPWGSIQIMGALHDASAGYYNPTFGGAATTGSGHPSNELGWAVGAGARLRIGPDVFETQFTYTQGALRYLIHAQSAAGYYQFGRSGTVGEFGYGIFTDGVFGAPGTSIELTTGWAINASYDHRWSPTLKTSIYGSYISISYNGTANTALCAAQVATAAASGGFAGATFAGACDNDWQTWYIGSRTQWDVAKGFYVGVDVLYHKLQTANDGTVTAAGFTPGAPRIAGTYQIRDQENWSVVFRAHRDIIP
ncbi:MAG TPA: porin [Xanthobacteraceae bacterium]|nr:porin [Xanthobacteraceae bacterium]